MNSQTGRKQLDNATYWCSAESSPEVLHSERLNITLSEEDEGTKNMLLFHDVGLQLVTLHFVSQLPKRTFEKAKFLMLYT